MASREGNLWLQDPASSLSLDYPDSNSILCPRQLLGSVEGDWPLQSGCPSVDNPNSRRQLQFKHPPHPCPLNPLPTKLFTVKPAHTEFPKVFPRRTSGWNSVHLASDYKQTLFLWQDQLCPDVSQHI